MQVKWVLEMSEKREIQVIFVDVQCVFPLYDAVKVHCVCDGSKLESHCAIRICDWSTQKDSHEIIISYWPSGDFVGSGWLRSGNAKNAKKQQLDSVTTTT